MKTNEELTKKEREYLIGELISILGSVRYGGNQELDEDNLMKLSDEEFDIKEKEFNLIKSIIKKLKK